MPYVRAYANVPGATLPFLQYVVTLAVVEALQQAGTQYAGTPAGAARFPFFIKWPNDIYAEGEEEGGAKVKSGG